MSLAILSPLRYTQLLAACGFLNFILDNGAHHSSRDPRSTVFIIIPHYLHRSRCWLPHISHTSLFRCICYSSSSSCLIVCKLMQHHRRHYPYSPSGSVRKTRPMVLQLQSVLSCQKWELTACNTLSVLPREPSTTFPPSIQVIGIQPHK